MYTGALLLLVGLTVLTVWLASTVMFRLEPGADQKELLARLGQWAAKGLVLPAAVWTLMNIGMPWLSWRLQPFAPRIQAAQKSGQPWFPIFLGVCIAGFFVVASFWCAVTVIWALGKSRQKMDLTARKEFRGLCLAAVLGLALPALFVLWAGGFAASGLALDLIAVPIAFYTPPLLSRPVRASYSRAIARMKMGKFDEAELEIIQQLETRADDYTGWMMMAELYAVHFRDLVEARKTILEVCGQPNITPSQYSVALHRLADWQLSIGKDPESARAALQMVCDHLPGTHLAKMAAARQQRLPLTAEDLRQQSTPHLIHRPALGDAFDELVSEEQSKADLHKAVEQANRCVEKLRINPDAIDERENLARLLAERLDQPELAIEQINLLLEQSDQPEMRRAEWLGLAASWHLKYRQDAVAARQNLERICSDFPRTPHALLAGARLRKMNASPGSAAQAT